MAKYKEEQESRYTARTITILSELPSFCTTFYDKNQTTFLPKTQYDYVRSMRFFLQYLQHTNHHFKNRDLPEYTLEDLDMLTVKDANDFISWLQNKSVSKFASEGINSVETKSDTKSNKMSISSIRTRISCISSYFTFFAKNGQISGNPFLYANRPKNDIQQRFSGKEVATQELLIKKTISNGQNASTVKPDDKEEIRMKENSNQTVLNSKSEISFRKKRFQEQYGLRDEIICKILLETEIRISELAELNIQDFDLKNHRFYVYRTNQKSSWVEVSEELSNLIQTYLEERVKYSFVKDSEAMFLVTIGRHKGSRLGIRSIERIFATIRKRQL